MSIRGSHRWLARPAAPAAPGTSAAAAPLPLLRFPAFHPVPFQQDKFLSIKTRSLETYTKLRGDVLQRCTELQSQIQRHHAQGGRRHDDGHKARAVATALDGSLSSSAAASPAADAPPPLPLTPHQAEELLLLSKKADSLWEYQGLVLSDELVWRMFHLCVQCGAPQQALERWLRRHILAEKRGPPYPLFILQDLASILRGTALPRLPESGASLGCGSALLLDGSGNSSAALHDGLLAAHRFLRFVMQQDENVEAVTGRGVSSSTAVHTATLLQTLVWPVWHSLEAMQLTLKALQRPRRDGHRERTGAAGGEEEDPLQNEEGDADADGDGEGDEGVATVLSLPTFEQQVHVVRSTLMAISPLYSFYPDPSAQAATRGSSGSGSSNRAQMLLALHPPSFGSEAEAVVAPLRALLDVWMAVVQCAAEAKDTQLMHEMQRTICTGFFMEDAAEAGQRGDLSGATTTTTAASPDNDGAAVGAPLRINEAAWCDYVAACRGDKDDRKEFARAATEQATALVHAFVGNALSVTHYGLLCAEQEAALWQLHDGLVLTLAGAAITHGKRQPLSPSAAASPRLRSLAMAQPDSSEHDASHLLLLRVLPDALRATANTAARTLQPEPFVRQAMGAFLAAALRSPNSGAMGSPYAEAAMYVGLATGNGTLLDAAAAEDTAMVRLTLDALQRHRRAVQLLAEAPAGSKDSHAADDGGADGFWGDVTVLLEASLAEADGDGDGDGTAAAHVLDGCLQAVVLHAAHQQAELAAAYVRTVTALRDADDGAVDDGGGVDEEADGDHEHHHRPHHHSVQSEELRQEAAQQALAELHAQGTACFSAVLDHVAALLDKAVGTARPIVLSPSTLSSLAVLARLGVYLTEEAPHMAEEASDSKAAAAAALSSSLDSIVSRLTRDSCSVLQHAVETPATSAATVGTWVQWVLLTLAARRDWHSLLLVLRSMEKAGEGEGGAGTSLLSSATMDPAVFAALYDAAQVDGAASVCAFLRPRRAALFF